jgi:Skp family chaperone for outer membrane proteins
MRSLACWIFGLAVFSLQLLPAHAAQSPTKIGIFDLQKIITELNPKGAAGNEIRSPASQTDKEEVEKLRGEIARLKERLEQTGLSEEERKKAAEQRTQYQQKLRAITSKTWSQPPALEEEILAAVARYGEENGFTILFEKSYWTEGNGKNGVVFTEKVVDISPEIIRRLKAAAQRAKGKEEPPKKSEKSKVP